MRTQHKFDVGDVVCVVRSVGERASGACVETLRNQLGANPAVVGRPVFRATLRECFELGRVSGKPLLLTCDADVLPYRGAVQELLRLDSQVPASYFQVVCEVDDHLFGGHRNGGLRLYRTEHLGFALEELDRADSHRPESGLVKPMAERGHPSAYGASVLGLHDAEQFHADVFRKAGFFAHKHASSIPELAVRWRAGRATSAEFAVALLGLTHGLLSDTPGPDLQSAFSANDQILGVGSKFAELAALTKREMSSLIASSPTVTPVDRWVTYPAPRDFLARAKERRRLGESVLRDLVRRGVTERTAQVEQLKSLQKQMGSAARRGECCGVAR